MRSPTADPRKRTLTAAELGAYLQLSDDQVRRLARRGEIPGVRLLGGRIRFCRPAVMAWLDGRTEAQERALQSEAATTGAAAD